MPVVVETGSGGDPAANAFVSLADATTFHAERGNSAWAAAGVTDEQRNAAIIRAADYLNYAYRWYGSRLVESQPMEWPRVFTYSDARYPISGLENTVPKEVVRANAELALMALTGDLLPATTGQRVTSESVSIPGAVTESKTYAGGGGFSNERRFPMIDRILSKLAVSGTTGVTSARIERA